jgi:hypothetical protein
MPLNASRLIVAATASCVCSAIVLAAAGPSKADATSLLNKVTGITQSANLPVRGPRRTMVTQNEVNAYLLFEAGEQIPTGIVDPAINILGGGRVSASAVVDLDAVRKQKTQRSLLDPMNFATGRVPVMAVGVLRTSGGVGRVEFESASIGPLPVPKVILQEIVSYYSRSPERPGGLGLEDPFTLPARIREIQVETGRAIVIQ